MNRFSLTDSRSIRIVVVILLIIVGVWSRFVPHPANFTALTAIALLSGAVLPRRISVIVPLLAMMVSDLFIGIHSLSVVVWLSFACATLIGWWVARKLTVSRVVFASIASSTLFFIITNFAVWVEGRMYMLRIDGLVQCYVNALPFYRTMLLGDLLYTGIVFGLYALVVYVTALGDDKKQASLTV